MGNKKFDNSKPQLYYDNYHDSIFVLYPNDNYDFFSNYYYVWQTGSIVTRASIQEKFEFVGYL